MKLKNISDKPIELHLEGLPSVTIYPDGIWEVKPGYVLPSEGLLDVSKEYELPQAEIIADSVESSSEGQDES